MRIRKMRLVLPARMARIGGHEARRIAEAMATELASRDQAPSRIDVALTDVGYSGAQLSEQVAAAVSDGLSGTPSGAEPSPSNRKA